MRIWPPIVSAVVAVVAVGSASAQPLPASPPDPALDATMRADVERANPAALVPYDQANAARDAGELDDAVTAYQQASALAPTVDHPHRRACAALVTLDRLEDAAVECEAALELAPGSPYNQSQLALVLLTLGDSDAGPRALELATTAARALPNDAETLEVWCQALGAASEYDQLHVCVDRLLALEPDGLGANYLAAVTAGGDSNFAEARRRLDKARAAGLPEDQYKQLLAGLKQAEADTAPKDRVHPIRWLALALAVVLVGGAIVVLVRRRRSRAAPPPTAADDATS